jgi:hypothetical protein
MNKTPIDNNLTCNNPIMLLITLQNFNGNKQINKQNVIDILGFCFVGFLTVGLLHSRLLHIGLLPIGLLHLELLHIGFYVLISRNRS